MTPATLDAMARQIAAADPAVERLEYGPWRGSKRSVSAEQVGREFIADPVVGTTFSKNYHYAPGQGFWKRRKGQAQAFDTFGSAVGQLPAKWSGRCRQLDEFISDSFTDGIPSIAALVTKETVGTAPADSGRFSNFYVRDQVNGLNYTVGADYDTTNTYPAPGTVQKYKFAPLWYESGDGGITRGIEEFQRRLFFGGSRSFQTVGKWTYFPSRYGTPSRWRGTFTPSAALVQTAVPGFDQAGLGGPWGKTGASTASGACGDGVTVASDGSYITFDITGGAGPNGGVLEMYTSGTLPTDPGIDSGFVLKIRGRCSNNAGVTNRRIRFGLQNINGGGGSVFSGIAIGGNGHTAGNVSNWVRASDGTTVTVLSTSFDTYTYSLSGAECALLKFSPGCHSSPMVDFFQAALGISPATSRGTSMPDLLPIPKVEI